MSWEYHWLKRALDLPDDDLLPVFERWCVDGWRDLSRMEWSVKIVGDTYVPNRFVQTCRVRSAEGLQGRLLPLLATLDHDETPWPMAADAWRREVIDRSRLAVVAWAGPDPTRDTEGAIKVYLGLKRYDASFHAHTVRPQFPALPKRPPPGDVGVMVASTLRPGEAPAPRLYLSWAREALASADVQEYLDGLGIRAPDLDAYARVTLSLKTDGTDLVSYKVGPPGTSVHDLARRLAEGLPLLSDRARRLAWCGLPFDYDPHGDALPEEANLYVRLES